MVGNILLFCQILISLYSLYINFKNSEYMKQSNWHNSIICYVFRLFVKFGAWRKIGNEI